MTPIRPLPRSLAPLPDESLPGYLLRLAYRLGLTPAGLMALTGLSSAPDRRTRGLSAVRAPSSLMVDLDSTLRTTFAHATRLTPGETAGLCLSVLAKRYPPAAPSPHRYLPGSLQSRRWVFTQATRYCPPCLAGDGSAIQRAYGGAWRKSWRLPVTFACTTHRRFLEHQCPSCQQPALSRAPTVPIRLLPGSADSSLHPAQCRNTVPASTTACGTRLDAVATAVPGGAVPSSVLDLQQRILELLRLDGPDMTMSIGHHTAVACYFTDLRLLVSLICASWPRARDLAPSTALADAVDDHAAWQQAQLDLLLRRAHVSASNVHRLYDSPPLDASACAGLLAIADEILRLDAPDTVGERLRPLLADQERPIRRTPWGRHFLRSDPGCSEAFRQALEPLVRTYTRIGRNCHARRAPARQTRFGPEHIPQALLDDWHDRYFRHLDGLSPRLLRRIAALRLIQISAGGSLLEAARFLGFPPDKGDYPGAGPVRTWIRSRDDPRALDRAVHALADELDATPGLVDYRQRRGALTGWCIAPDTWQQITNQLPATHHGQPPHLDDRKRQEASVLAWAHITQGERQLAPRPLQAAQPPDIQRLWKQRHPGTWRCFWNPGPSPPHYVELKRLLDAYADELAARIDAGWKPVHLRQLA